MFDAGLPVGSARGQDAAQSQRKGSSGSARWEDRSGTTLLDSRDLAVQLLMSNIRREASAT